MRWRCSPLAYPVWWQSSACRAGAVLGMGRAELVFALDADTAGQQQWQALARQAALRGKQVAVLESEAYGGQKDVSAAWAAGVLTVGAGPATPEGKARAVSRA